MCSTAEDSGQDSSEAHEEETRDLSQQSLMCVLYVITLGPQLVVLFGKVIQTLEGNFAGGSMSQGAGFEIFLSLRVSVSLSLSLTEFRSLTVVLKSGPSLFSYGHKVINLNKHLEFICNTEKPGGKGQHLAPGGYKLVSMYFVLRDMSSVQM